MMKLRKSQRSGDDWYTPEFVVENIIKEYDGIFNQYDIIWIPFCKAEAPMYRLMFAKYGNKVVLTPDKFYNEEIGLCDFNLAIADSDWINYITSKKILIFDNPPFSYFSKIIIPFVMKYHIDFILFYDIMTANNILKKQLGIGIHAMGRINYINDSKYKDRKDTRINSALYSNLFKEVKWNFNIDKKPHKLEWDDTINIDRFRNQVMSSANMNCILQRGYVFELDRFHFDKKWSKFGGACKYDF